jgi:CBS domain-containing protein
MSQRADRPVQVKDLMSRGVVTVGTGASCLAALEQMHTAQVRHLPVVSRDGLLIGMLTDRDLRHHLFSPRSFEALSMTPVEAILSATLVAEIMSTGVIAVDPEETVVEAAWTMRKYQIGALPVTERGRVVGILTEIDVLRHIVRKDAGRTPACAEIIVPCP